MYETSKQLKKAFPHIMLEASGGISEENVHRFAKPTIDIISMSSLVQVMIRVAQAIAYQLEFDQGYEAVDFSMKVLPK